MCCDRKDKILRRYINNNLECDEILKELKEIHQKSPYIVANHVNKNSNVCFVFSCPGRHELINNQLLCGSTGENLNILWNSAFGSDFSKLSKLDKSTLVGLIEGGEKYKIK